MKIKKIISIVLILALLISTCSTFVSAEYSIYKADKATLKDNTYIKGNDTAIIWVPGYRCTNLEANVDVNNDGVDEKVVTFAVGSEVFKQSEDYPFIINLLHGVGNLLISGAMILTAQLRKESVHVSYDGGFGLADIYRSFFENCVKNYDDTCDVIVYDFDWRIDATIMVEDLYNVIKSQQYKKVILVTQSMGGLIASGVSKLLWDDLQDSDTSNDVDVYTVNVGSTVLGGFGYFHNAKTFEGFDKISMDYVTYATEVDFPSRTQLAVPTQVETLYGRKYATAKIEKADGSVVYEDIAAEDAFEAYKKICVNGNVYMQMMQDFYDNYIFIDNDNNPATEDVHIMEELGSKCYYISGLASDTPTHVQINFKEDAHDSRTPVDCEAVRTDDSSLGDGSLTIESSTMNGCSPETTFYVPYGHQSVYFHDDTQHLMYDIITHLVDNPAEKFDYTDTDYQYTEVYTKPQKVIGFESDNLLYPQIVKYILGLLGIQVTYEAARSFCHKLFSIIG
ncbi:MAG: alpha/beta hydrolase [Clostridia bacterium]|nr:alpha/beta hydrolase [Clostridia bacterium]